MSWLSVVIPTAGQRHDGLIRTLESIRGQQHGEQIEVLVVADTYASEDQRPAFDALAEDVRRYRATWLEHDAGLHCVGQPQRSAGARAARGEWVAFSQDDNCLTDGALNAIWLGVCQQPHKRPLFFRVRTFWGEIVWHEPKLRHANIDADCIVLPRDLAHEVTWGLRYEGDYDAAVDAASRASGDVGWCEDVIAIARPASPEWWWMK